MTANRDRALGALTARSWGRLRVPAHRASSATLGGAYPFLAPPPSWDGTPVGTDAITGEAFCFDPWALYAAGTLTNPNVALAAVIGAGKSALAKSLAVRAVAAGRRAYVPGDPKGEWAPVAARLGGTVLRLGPGLPARLNPLSESGQVGDGARVLAAVAETLLSRALLPGERTALDAAMSRAADAVTSGRVPLVRDVLGALVDPDPAQARVDGTSVSDRTGDGREVMHALRRLVTGDLGGMFDGPSTLTLDPATPMVVIDLSALGSDDTAVAVAMTCASAWLEAALADAGSGARGPVGDLRRGVAAAALTRAGPADAGAVEALPRPRDRQPARAAPTL